MEPTEAGISPKGNPYSLESLIQNAAVSLRKSQPVELTGKHSVTVDGGTIIVDTSKSAGSFKTFTVDEAKSLEIISKNDLNPFGELGQDFSEHFNEIVASSEAISKEKDRLSSAVVLGTKVKSLETFGDVLKGLRRPDPISGAFPQSQQGLSPLHPEPLKSGELPHIFREAGDR
jgi:hypothetical protein